CASGLLLGCSGVSPNLGVAPTPSSNVSALSPSSAFAGTSGITLMVTGAGFVSGSRVLWNNQPRTTTFISSNSLQATIPASDLSAPATVAVGVMSPPVSGTQNAGNNLSNFLPFAVNPTNNPIPSITQLNPSTAASGSGTFTLSITGSNFISGTTVIWNSQTCA